MRALTRDEYMMLTADGTDACGPGCALVRACFTVDHATRAVGSGLLVLEDCPHNESLAHGRVTALGKLAVLCYELVHMRLTA